MLLIIVITPIMTQARTGREKGDQEKDAKRVKMKDQITGWDMFTEKISSKLQKMRREDMKEGSFTTEQNGTCSSLRILKSPKSKERKCQEML